MNPLKKLKAFLKNLVTPPQQKGERYTVVEHKRWCPLLRRKGPCNCHPTSYTVSQEEFEKIVFEQKKIEEEVDDILRSLDGLLKAMIQKPETRNEE